MKHKLSNEKDTYKLLKRGKMTGNYEKVKHCGTLQTQVFDANNQQSVLHFKECNLTNNK